MSDVAKELSGILTTKDLEREYKIEVRTQATMRFRGQIPFVRLGGGRLIRYRRADIEQWLAQRSVSIERVKCPIDADDAASESARLAKQTREQFEWLAKRNIELEIACDGQRRNDPLVKLYHAVSQWLVAPADMRESRLKIVAELGSRIYLDVPSRTWRLR